MFQKMCATVWFQSKKPNRDYGVVMNAKTLAIDESATDNLRNDLREKRGEFPLFSIGQFQKQSALLQLGTETAKPKQHRRN